MWDLSNNNNNPAFAHSFLLTRLTQLTRIAEIQSDFRAFLLQGEDLQSLSARLIQ